MNTCIAKMPRRRGMAPDLVCGNRARELVNGEPMCGTHARLNKLCQRGKDSSRACSCRARSHWINRGPGRASCGTCGAGCCPDFLPPETVLLP